MTNNKERDEFCKSISKIDQCSGQALFAATLIHSAAQCKKLAPRLRELLKTFEPTDRDLIEGTKLYHGLLKAGLRKQKLEFK